MYRFFLLELCLILLIQWASESIAFAQSVTLDSSFADHGIFLFSVPQFTSTNATGIELQNDGKYVLSGKTASQSPNVSLFLAVRLNHNGTLDNSFGTGGYSANN